ncbi:response regulator transcription factor [Clostridium gasigenes]|uniref:Stage 0 sporulation protein A homolog n=1 Tax=Clostridium gasigenes TaxID=94869 RepID=A0A1H0VSV4_9CLOT|nr:response regulator transcription factor [Clostridium gasigenes]MBB6622505.1 response regulator transcription factor [Clostridium gasigenes]MBB6714152.1 response regulator transcription factor [Clostridium gasigenes]MBU3088485.1 response regulator transcription factor [Clostridium gasigenes]MBU3103919.1 response regulator transcription factor [Clostridium gasigenes]MBU3132740.1 response regulator transcription factor [Clostridium gasigenes]
MTKILLVEDEVSIRGFLKINLIRNEFEVIEAGTGEEGIEKAIKEKPSIAILDVMLPGIDGFQVCEKLRLEYPEMGIIMLTAKGQDMDKIMGLEYGADDYILKPFNPIEVVLRVKALLRRVGNVNSNKDKLINGPFIIDLYSKKLLKNHVEIDVTPKEYALIKLFIENPNKGFSRDELLDLVWGYSYFGDSKLIDVNIRRLRAKIEENSSEPKYIETIWGVGYRWKILK